MSKKKDRVGEVHYNNVGEQFIIIEYINNKNVRVQFVDEYKFSYVTNYGNILKGKVENPYYKSVANMGFRGFGKYSCTTHEKEYDLWNGMINRCYNPKVWERNPTYEQCEVCERWLNFQLFCEDLALIDGYFLWVNNTEKHGVALDKDIKVKGNKVYCKECCMFVTINENSKDVAIRQKTKPIIGVSLKDGSTINLQSAKDGEQYGFLRNKLQACCVNKYGKQGNVYKGYKWKYVEDDIYE